MASGTLGRRGTDQQALDTAALARLLREAVERGAASDMPCLAGVLAETQARVALRLAAIGADKNADATQQPRRVGADRLLTPQQAAEIAAVPVARIYAWARGRDWASRPSRRCLRIAERGFHRWLASRA